jgi:hypothetical protein
LKVETWKGDYCAKWNWKTHDRITQKKKKKKKKKRKKGFPGRGSVWNNHILHQTVKKDLTREEFYCKKRGQEASSLLLSF